MRGELIVSVHIPKTGGSTFRKLLKNAFPDNLFFDYEDKPLRKRYTKRIVSRMGASREILNKIYEQQRRDTVLVHGHFFASKYSYFFPNSRKAVWVRDPVERLASHFYFWRRNPDLNHEVCRKLNEENLSLLEFSRLPQMKNFMSFYMNGQDVRDFDFVGITENFDESIELFKNVFEISLPLVDERVFENPDREAERYKIEASVRSEIVTNNYKDMLFYSDAKLRYEELKSKFGV